MADFSFETPLWNQGLDFVAGVDEVGRGAIAGPVVTAAVVFPKDFNHEFLNQINDSKLLTAKKREFLTPLIKEHCLWSISLSSVSHINNHGINKSVFKAMRACLKSLSSLDYVLTDAFRIPKLSHFSNKQTPIIKGDQKSLSIAAASIIAKTYRDELMTKLDRTFPQYFFAKHKGYGTKVHQKALQRNGPCKHHRQQYIRNLLDL